MLRYIFFLLLGMALSAAAAAQPQRLLPAHGKLGELGAPLPLPMVQIGSRVLRLAPGAVIYDQANRSILQQALPSDAPVYYTTNAAGDVQRLYILTPAEQARLGGADAH